jgi:hypothetical protein
MNQNGEWERSRDLNDPTEQYPHVVYLIARTQLMTYIFIQSQHTKAGFKSVQFIHSESCLESTSLNWKMKKGLTGSEIHHSFRQICNASSPSWTFSPFLPLAERGAQRLFHETRCPASYKRKQAILLRNVNTGSDEKMWRLDCRTVYVSERWKPVTEFLGEINTRTCPSWLGGGGGLKNIDNKLCSWVPWHSDLSKAALAMPGKNGKVQTRLLVREGAPHQQTQNCQKK